jgi:hypothetical protein
MFASYVVLTKAILLEDMPHPSHQMGNNLKDDSTMKNQY